MAFKSKAVKTSKEVSNKAMHNPWKFDAPSYDDRNRVSAGGEYGVGSTQPVGHEGENAKQHADCFPQDNIVKSLIDHE